MSKSNYSSPYRSASDLHSVSPGSLHFRPLDLTPESVHPGSLNSNSIHLWTAETNLSAVSRSRLESVLLPDERERAGRFRFDRDRLLFLTARGMLRILLGRYLNADPRSFTFTAGEFGKPMLAPNDCTGVRPLEFNVAHSGKRVLVGFAHRPVGVDIELAEADREFLSIARRYFSQREQKELRDLPPELTARGFYNAWSRKEAFLKATGIGLSQNLDTFDVSLDPRQPAVLHEVRDSALAAGRRSEAWHLANLAVDPDYSAAVAYYAEGPQTELLGFRVDLNQ